MFIQPNNLIFYGNDFDDQMMFLRKSEISAVLVEWAWTGMFPGCIVNIVTIPCAPDVTRHWSPETEHRDSVTRLVTPDARPGLLSSQPGESRVSRDLTVREITLLPVIWAISSVMKLLSLACVALAQCQWAPHSHSQVCVNCVVLVGCGLTENLDKIKFKV